MLGEQQDYNEITALMKKKEAFWYIEKVSGERQEETKQVISLGFGGLEVFLVLCWFVVDGDVLVGWLAGFDVAPQ